MKLAKPVFCLPEIFSRIQLGIDAGVAHASWMMGNAFYLGTIGSKDFQRAAYYYKIAHEQGSVYAGHSLGTLYELGLGVDRDFTMAFEYFKANAARGHCPSQRKTALAYLSGTGVNIDQQKAEEYFILAAINGCKDSDWMLQVHDALGSYPLPSPGETVLHLLREAEAGNTRAMRALGLANEFAVGYSRTNEELALTWYRRAAELGCPRAACDLASHVLPGNFTDSEKSRAVEYLLAASELGFLQATNLLAVALAEGSGGPKMVKMANQLFEELMAAEYFPAAGNIAAYLLGDAPTDKLILQIADLLQAAHSVGINSVREDLIKFRRRFPRLFQQNQENLILMEMEASSSNVNVTLELARIYLDDSRTAELHLLNGPRGLFWLQVGVCDLSVAAMDILAWELMRGKYVPADRPSALALLNSAAALGYADAAFGLAYYHATDSKIITNREFVVKMYESAAVMGNKPAKQNLAFHLQRGDGVKADSDLANALAHMVQQEIIADASQRSESFLQFESQGLPLKNGGKVLNFQKGPWPESQKSS